MIYTISSNGLCSICKQREAITTNEIRTDSKITSYVVVAATITDTYLTFPTCEICSEEFSSANNYKSISGILAILSLFYAVCVLFELTIRLRNSQITDYKSIIIGLVTFACAVVFPYLFLKTKKKLNFLVSKAKSHSPSTENFQNFNKTSQESTKLQISSQSLLWIEKEILKLNREIKGEDRPEHNPNFFQVLPKSFLAKETLTTDDVAQAATELVKQTRERIEKLDVPFRKPRVEFTKQLPEDEPGHIEFGSHETIIRIHPDYIDNHFALASILCHELAHFILDHNGLRKDDRIENEKLTDLFVFKCGQGLIYLQGIVDVKIKNGQSVESRLGYLSLEEMAYAHVRCSSQYGLLNSKISPDYYSGKTFEQVKKAIDFLTIKKDSETQLAEMILCPNNHLLRVSANKTSVSIRCPKCKWEQEVWMHKKDKLTSLMKRAENEFDSGNILQALKHFRDAQMADEKYSTAYCRASRCLKKLGKHQDAIKELQKLLTICPEDAEAQDEMKKLIYS